MYVCVCWGQGARDFRIVWIVVAVGHGGQPASVWTVLVRVGGKVCQQTLLVCCRLDLLC